MNNINNNHKKKKNNKEKGGGLKERRAYITFLPGKGKAYRRGFI